MVLVECQFVAKLRVAELLHLKIFYFETPSKSVYIISGKLLIIVSIK